MFALQAARTSLSKVHVSFTGGAVMGVGVAGLAVLGLGGLYIILKQVFAQEPPSTRKKWSGPSKY